MSIRIGERLSALLKQRGRKVNELAAAVGVSPSTVYAIISRNNTKVAVTTLKKIAHELGVTIDYFADENIDINGTHAFIPNYDWLIHQWELLDDRGQKLVRCCLETERERSEQLRNRNAETKTVRLPLFDLQIDEKSGGMYLGDIRTLPYVDIPISEVPNGASYVLTVKGNHAAPKYKDGERVYIKAESDIAAFPQDSYGVFSIGGFGYIERVIKSRKKTTAGAEADDSSLRIPRGVIIGRYEDK